jgi:hypothetical protein
MMLNEMVSETEEKSRVHANEPRKMNKKAIKGAHESLCCESRRIYLFAFLNTFSADESLWQSKKPHSKRNERERERERERDVPTNNR